MENKMTKIDNLIKDFILQNIDFQGKERDKYIIEGLLTGTKQRDFIWNNESVNVGTVNTTRQRYIPFVKFERSGDILIVDNVAPTWLRESVHLQGETVQPTAVVKQRKLDFSSISLEEHQTRLDAFRENLNLEKQRDFADLKIKIERELKEKFASDLDKEKANCAAKIEEITKQIANIKAEHTSRLHSLKDEMRLKHAKEFSEIYGKQIDTLQTELDKAKVQYENLKGEYSSLEMILKDESLAKSNLEKDKQDLTAANEKLNAEILELKAQVEKLTPKIDRAFILQSFISFGFLAGLLALSVFTVENMLIFFNAGSYWIVAIILGVFIEYMLWATNIARFSGSLDDIDSTHSLDQISGWILAFRGFCNSLGGYYLATNAKELVKGHDLASKAVKTFTDIDELYFGAEMGQFGMILTTIIIGLFIAYIEYKLLPLAIKHFYNLFIKKV